MSTFDAFCQAVDAAVTSFAANSLCRRVDDGSFTKSDYHALLTMIFPQVYEGPQTFALAGVTCSRSNQRAKDYLFAHAEEERSHWRWILDDLASTDYKGVDPRDVLPEPAAQDYVSLLFFVALRYPLARLATAAVLEGIGSRHGHTYARGICQVLELEPGQSQFFLNHGITDREHSKEILTLLEECHLSATEWGWMCHFATTAGRLYSNMYEAVARSKCQPASTPGRG